MLMKNNNRCSQNLFSLIGALDPGKSVFLSRVSHDWVYKVFPLITLMFVGLLLSSCTRANTTSSENGTAFSDNSLFVAAQQTSTQIILETSDPTNAMQTKVVGTQISSSIGTQIVSYSRLIATQTAVADVYLSLTPEPTLVASHLITQTAVADDLAKNPKELVSYLATVTTIEAAYREKRYPGFSATQTKIADTYSTQHATESLSGNAPDIRPLISQTARASQLTALFSTPTPPPTLTSLPSITPRNDAEATLQAKALKLTKVIQDRDATLAVIGAQSKTEIANAQKELSTGSQDATVQALITEMAGYTPAPEKPEGSTGITSTAHPQTPFPAYAGLGYIIAAVFWSGFIVVFSMSKIAHGNELTNSLFLFLPDLGLKFFLEGMNDFETDNLFLRQLIRIFDSGRRFYLILWIVIFIELLLIPLLVPSAYEIGTLAQRPNLISGYILFLFIFFLIFVCLTNFINSLGTVLGTAWSMAEQRCKNNGELTSVMPTKVFWIALWNSILNTWGQLSIPLMSVVLLNAALRTNWALPLLLSALMFLFILNRMIVAEKHISWMALRLIFPAIFTCSLQSVQKFLKNNFIECDHSSWDILRYIFKLLCAVLAPVLLISSVERELPMSWLISKDSYTYFQQFLSWPNSIFQKLVNISHSFLFYEVGETLANRFPQFQLQIPLVVDRWINIDLLSLWQTYSGLWVGLMLIVVFIIVSWFISAIIAGVSRIANKPANYSESVNYIPLFLTANGIGLLFWQAVIVSFLFDKGSLNLIRYVNYGFWGLIGLWVVGFIYLGIKKILELRLKWKIILIPVSWLLTLIIEPIYSLFIICLGSLVGVLILMLAWVGIYPGEAYWFWTYRAPEITIPTTNLSSFLATLSNNADSDAYLITLRALFTFSEPFSGGWILVLTTLVLLLSMAVSSAYSGKNLLNFKEEKPQELIAPYFFVFLFGFLILFSGFILTGSYHSLLRTFVEQYHLVYPGWVEFLFSLAISSLVLIFVIALIASPDNELNLKSYSTSIKLIYKLVKIFFVGLFHSSVHLTHLLIFQMPVWGPGIWKKLDNLFFRLRLLKEKYWPEFAKAFDLASKTLALFFLPGQRSFRLSLKNNLFYTNQGTRLVNFPDIDLRNYLKPRFRFGFTYLNLASYLVCDLILCFCFWTLLPAPGDLSLFGNKQFLSYLSVANIKIQYEVFLYYPRIVLFAFSGVLLVFIASLIFRKQAPKITVVIRQYFFTLLLAISLSHIVFALAFISWGIIYAVLLKTITIDLAVFTGGLYLLYRLHILAGVGLWVVLLQHKIVRLLNLFFGFIQKQLLPVMFATIRDFKRAFVDLSRALTYPVDFRQDGLLNLFFLGLGLNLIAVLLTFIGIPLGGWMLSRATQVLGIQFSLPQAFLMEDTLDLWWMRFAQVMLNVPLMAFILTSSLFYRISFFIADRIQATFGLINYYSAKDKSSLQRKAVLFIQNLFTPRYILNASYRQNLKSLSVGYVLAFGYATLILFPLRIIFGAMNIPAPVILVVEILLISLIIGIFLSNIIRSIPFFTMLISITSLGISYYLEPNVYSWIIPKLSLLILIFILYACITYANLKATNLKLLSGEFADSIFDFIVDHWKISETFASIEVFNVVNSRQIPANFQKEYLQSVRSLQNITPFKWINWKENPFIQLLQFYNQIESEKARIFLEFLLFSYSQENESSNLLENLRKASFRVATHQSKNLLDDLESDHDWELNLYIHLIIEFRQRDFSLLTDYIKQDDLPSLPVPTSTGEFIKGQNPISKTNNSYAQIQTSFIRLMDCYLLGELEPISNAWKMLFEDPQIPIRKNAAVLEILNFYSLVVAMSKVDSLKGISSIDLLLSELFETEFTYFFDANEPFRELKKITSSVLRAEEVSNLDRIPFYAASLTRLKSLQNLIPGNVFQPELNFLQNIINLWTTLLTQTLGQAAPSKANVDFYLGSSQIYWKKQEEISLVIENDGDGIARSVQAKLLPGVGYKSASTTPSITLDLIGAKKKAYIEFAVVFEKQADTILNFEITFDDAERSNIALKKDFLVTYIEFQQQLSDVELEAYPNPYIYGPPIIDSKKFFGREDILQKIYSILNAKDSAHVIMLYGQRRMGKTSLLQQIGQELLRGTDFYPILINMQIFTNAGVGGLIWEIAQTIHEKLPNNHRVGLPDKSMFLESPGPTLINKIIPAVEMHLKEYNIKVPLFLFDEFDSIYENPNYSQTDLRDFLGIIRGLTQERKQGGAIFVGTFKLLGMFTLYQSPLFNLAHVLRVGFLEQASAENLIRIPAEYLLSFDSAAVGKISRLTGNHPYFIQLLCYTIFNYCQENHQRYVGLSIVKNVMKEAQEQESAAIGYVWEELNGKEKYVLATIARLANHDTSLISISAIQHELTNFEIKIDIPEIEKIMSHFTDLEILRVAEDRYQFVIDLFRLWIKENKPLISVRAEIGLLV